MEEKDVLLRAAEETSGLDGAFRRVHQAGIADFDTILGEFAGDLGEVTLEAFVESQTS